MGAWIETVILDNLCGLGRVAPLVGAWIETNASLNVHPMFSASRPLWARGLKPAEQVKLIHPKKVAPLVGAWIETAGQQSQGQQSQVAPLVGAWIETSNWTLSAGTKAVAPLVGAWIETRYDILAVFAQGCRAPCGRVD